MRLTKQHIFALKILTFILASLPLLKLSYLAYSNQLGAHPIEFIERYTGLWALNMLLLTLSITPLKHYFSLNWPLLVRRMLGLWMFFYACVHFTTYIWLDYWFDWQEISQDLIKHPFIWLGFVALTLTTPLAATSNTYMITKLKRHWKTLHKLVYIISIFGVSHFLLGVKKDITQPVIYITLLAILLGSRLLPALRTFMQKSCKESAITETNVK